MICLVKKRQNILDTLIAFTVSSMIVCQESHTHTHTLALLYTQVNTCIHHCLLYPAMDNDAPPLSPPHMSFEQLLVWALPVPGLGDLFGLQLQPVAVSLLHITKSARF